MERHERRFQRWALSLIIRNNFTPYASFPTSSDFDGLRCDWGNVMGGRLQGRNCAAFWRLSPQVDAERTSVGQCFLCLYTHMGCVVCLLRLFLSRPSRPSRSLVLRDGRDAGPRCVDLDLDQVCVCEGDLVFRRIRLGHHAVVSCHRQIGITLKTNEGPE